MSGRCCSGSASLTVSFCGNFETRLPFLLFGFYMKTQDVSFGNQKESAVRLFDGSCIRNHGVTPAAVTEFQFFQVFEFSRRQSGRMRFNFPFLQKKAWRRETECGWFRNKGLSDAAARRGRSENRIRRNQFPFLPAKQPNWFYCSTQF